MISRLDYLLRRKTQVTLELSSLWQQSWWTSSTPDCQTSLQDIWRRQLWYSSHWVLDAPSGWLFSASRWSHTPRQPSTFHPLGAWCLSDASLLCFMNLSWRFIIQHQSLWHLWHGDRSEDFCQPSSLECLVWKVQGFFMVLTGWTIVWSFSLLCLSFVSWLWRLNIIDQIGIMMGKMKKMEFLSRNMKITTKKFEL